MKKQIPAILLGIACAILVAAYIKSNQSLKALQQQIAQLKSLPDTDTAIPKTAAPSEGQASTMEQPAVAEQIASPVAGEALAEAEKPRGRRMLENMAKMMENPTMNKVMEASQRGAVGALYTDLIAYLNLNPEETKYFMDLLMYRQMKQVDLAMKMMSGGLSEEEKMALAEEVAEASNTVKEEMEKFLNNPEDYAEWEFYEKTVGERMMLSQMDKDLAESGNSLSDATYRELLGIMHEEKENYDFTSDLSDNENMDMSAERFSSENLKNFSNDIRQLNDNISSKAKDILTAKQYEAFIGCLKTTTEMQLGQLEMAAQLFGGGE